MLFLSFVADVDVIFVAGYLAAAYFFLAYARREGGAGTLTLGALAAGGAWGSRVVGTVFVPPLLVGAAIAVLARGGPRPPDRPSAPAVPVALVDGWLLVRS